MCVWGEDRGSRIGIGDWGLGIGGRGYGVAFRRGHRAAGVRPYQAADSYEARFTLFGRVRLLGVRYRLVYDLGDLPSRCVVSRAEGPVAVPTDDVVGVCHLNEAEEGMS